MQKLSAEQQTMLRQSLEKKSRPSAGNAGCAKPMQFEDVIRCLPEENVRQTEAAALSKFSKPSQHGMNPLPLSPTPPMPSSKSAANCLTAKSAAVSTTLTIPKPTAAYTVISITKNCASIYLLERPFMGKATCSLNFINRNGGAMFKIFVGRDEAGELKQHQIEAMRKLFDAA